MSPLNQNHTYSRPYGWYVCGTKFSTQLYYHLFKHTQLSDAAAGRQNTHRAAEKLRGTLYTSGLFSHWHIWTAHKQTFSGSTDAHVPPCVIYCVCVSVDQCCPVGAALCLFKLYCEWIVVLWPLTLYWLTAGICVPASWCQSPSVLSLDNL